MSHTVQTLPSGQGNTLRYQSWRPQGTPRGVVFVVHGLAEHGGRYEEFASLLNQSGLAVATVDLPGHGHSSGKRCCVTHFDQYLAAVETAVDAATAEFQDAGSLPFFLLGHSMGGLIASLHLQRHAPRFAGALFSGAAIAADPEPPKLQTAVIKILARLFPEVGLVRLDANGVSRDPLVVERYVQDPLVYTGKLPAGLLAAMIESMNRAVEGLASITLPVLVMHGEADSIVPVKASRILMDRIGSEDKKLCLYPGLFHEIFNEPERADVIGEAIGWVENHL